MGRSRFWNPGVRPLPNIAMIGLYCDESHDTETYTLAGWMASPDAWDRITPRWRDMLKKHNISAFHAAEICGRDRISDSRFKGMTFDQEKALFTDAVNVILKKKTCRGWLTAIGCSISRPAIEKSFSRKEEAIDRNIWFLLFTRLFHILAVDLHPNHGVGLMFDEKPEVRKIVDDYYFDAKKATSDLIPDKFPRSTVAFGSDEKEAPLQMADFFAYEWRKRISDKPRNKTERKSFTRLKHRPKVLKHYNSEAIANIQAQANASGKTFIEVMWEYPTTED